MKKYLLIIAILQLANTFGHAQQDAQISQYMFHGIYINPAYAGYKEQLNVHAFYRNQWVGLEGAPKTLSLAVDAIANEGKVGLALQISNDKIGAQRNLAAYANYAYRVQMDTYGESMLAFGLGLGMIQMGIDGSLLNPNDFESQLPPGMQSKIVPDARAGVFFSNEKFYAGFSVDNLIPQWMSMSNYAFISKPKPHYYLTAGMLIPLNEYVQLKPSFLLKDDRASVSSLDATAFFILNDKIWLGGSYRTGLKLYNKGYLQKDLNIMSSATGAAQFYVNDNIRIGYSYDFSLGGLRSYNNGTHEISIGYSIGRKYIRLSNPRYF